MNKTEIERGEDVFCYLYQSLNTGENSKRNRDQNEFIKFEKLYQLNEILEKAFNIDVSFFFLDHNASRTRYLVYLRFICFNFLREKYNLRTIARMLNRKDHSTVIHGIEQYDLMCKYPDFLFKPFNDQFNRAKDELGY